MKQESLSWNIYGRWLICVPKCVIMASDVGGPSLYHCCAAVTFRALACSLPPTPITNGRKGEEKDGGERGEAVVAKRSQEHHKIEEKTTIEPAGERMREMMAER